MKLLELYGVILKACLEFSVLDSYCSKNLVVGGFIKLSLRVLRKYYHSYLLVFVGRCGGIGVEAKQMKVCGQLI